MAKNTAENDLAIEKQWRATLQVCMCVGGGGWRWRERGIAFEKTHFVLLNLTFTKLDLPRALTCTAGE